MPLCFSDGMLTDNPLFKSSLSKESYEMASSFARHRDALEQEGVYIGGWSFRNALVPRKLNGKHGKYCNTDS